MYHFSHNLFYFFAAIATKEAEKSHKKVKFLNLFSHFFLFWGKIVYENKKYCVRMGANDEIIMLWESKMVQKDLQAFDLVRWDVMYSKYFFL